ncbi:amidohydrolase family protein [Paraclostridium bifermentans]|uniref:amidohydrolase family protein n=1 Tax=Paraclostridium bifermentans TaxID=1490 RepID=UPI00242ED5CC|nr:amidohydrolase family protein [Paraclostridium bifermentans]
MKIIDAHIHLVERIAGFCRRGELRAIGDGKARWANGDIMDLIPSGYGDKDFTTEALIRFMDDNSIDKAVLMQGSLYGFQNEYTYEACIKYPERLKGACTVDPFAENALEVLNRLVNKLNFKIIKLEVSSGGGLMGYHDKFSIDGEKMSKIWEVANNNNLTMVLDIGDHTMNSYQPEAIRNMALKYPNLKIVVCHLTAPSAGDEDKLKNTLEILNLPNISFDLAALPLINAPEKYPFLQTQNFIKIAKKIVGTNKLIFGSDSPMAAKLNSYKEISNYLIESNIFTQKELEDIFYNNAFKVYFEN